MAESIGRNGNESERGTLVRPEPWETVRLSDQAGNQHGLSGNRNPAGNLAE